MIWYEVKKRLENLIDVSKKINTLPELTVWMAEVGDLLQFVLPQTSDVLKEYSLRKEVLKKLGDDISPDDIIKETSKCVPFLEAAIRVGLLTYSDKGESDDLWSEFERIFMKRYIKSLWFYIPFGLLIFAILFAMFGVIQIQNYRADIRDVAEDAIERAMKRIDKTTGDAAEDIDNYKIQAIANLGDLTKTDEFIAEIEGEKSRIKNMYVEMANTMVTQNEYNDQFIKQLETNRGVLEKDLTENIPKQLTRYADDIENRVTESYNALVKETTNEEKEKIKSEIKALHEDAIKVNNTLTQAVEIAAFFREELGSNVNKIDDSIVDRIKMRLKVEYILWIIVFFGFFISLGFSYAAWKKTKKEEQ